MLKVIEDVVAGATQLISVALLSWQVPPEYGALKNSTVFTPEVELSETDIVMVPEMVPPFEGDCMVRVVANAFIDRLTRALNRVASEKLNRMRGDLAGNTVIYLSKLKRGT